MCRRSGPPAQACAGLVWPWLICTELKSWSTKDLDGKKETANGWYHHDNFDDDDDDDYDDDEDDDDGDGDNGDGGDDCDDGDDCDNSIIIKLGQPSVYCD